MKNILLNERMYILIKEISSSHKQFLKSYEKLKGHVQTLFDKLNIYDLEDLVDYTQNKKYESFEIKHDTYSKIILTSNDSFVLQDAVVFMLSDESDDEYSGYYTDYNNELRIYINNVHSFFELFTNLSHEHRHSFQYKKATYDYEEADEEASDRDYVNSPAEYDAELGALYEEMIENYFEVYSEQISQGSWKYNGLDLKEMKKLMEKLLKKWRFSYYNEKLRKKILKKIFNLKDRVQSTIKYNYKIYNFVRKNDKHGDKNIISKINMGAIQKYVFDYIKYGH